MDQVKTGEFLKQLRKQHNMTQQMLADKLGVTNRSVSRWENGNTMCDLDILVELSKMYNVSISEILNGEKDKADDEMIIVEYANKKQNIFRKNIHLMYLFSLALFIIYLVCLFLDITNAFLDFLKGFCLGFNLGMIIVGCIYTSKYLNSITKFKQNLFKH